MQVTRRVSGTVLGALSVFGLLSVGACSSEAGPAGSRVGGSREPKSTLIGAAGTGFNPNLANANTTVTTTTTSTVKQKLPDGVCAAATVTANREIPTVWLVIDGSTSMNTPFGLGAPGGQTGPGQGPGPGAGPAAAGGGGTRWTVLRDALVGPNGVVTKLESVVKFAMTIYGNIDPTMCPSLVEVKPPALMNLMNMSGMYPGVQTGGGTPTGEALQTVVDALPDFSNPTLDGRGEKAPIIILATDGEPNGCSEAIAAAVNCLAGDNPDPGACAGDLLNQVASAAATYDTTIKAVQTAKQKMIPVWVISLAAGLNNIPDLQRTANIGAGLDDNAMPGATIYSPQNPDDLTNTLSKLIGDQVDCTVELNGTLDVKRACEGTVNINGMPLMCNADSGWMPVDMKHIALQGAACEMFKSDPSVFLDARFPCGVVVPD